MWINWPDKPGIYWKIQKIDGKWTQLKLVNVVDVDDNRAIWVGIKVFCGETITSKNPHNEIMWKKVSIRKPKLPTE